MNTYKKSLVLALGVVLTGTGAGAAAAAPESSTSCSGTLSRQTLNDVTVAPGATCVLDTVVVKGSITVQGTGKLTVNRSGVRGGITASGDEMPYTSSVTVSLSGVGGAIRTEAPTHITRSAVHDVTVASSGDVTDSVVRGQASFSGLWGTAAVTRSVVTGSLTAAGGLTAADVTGSVVHGATALNADNDTVCGARLNGLDVDTEYNFRVGGPTNCAPNRIRGAFTVHTVPYDAAVYNTTVQGATTSPEGRGRNENLNGSGNHFEGGVTGFLTAVR